MSDKLADSFPKARRFKRGDLSAMHPQQSRLFRTDHILRGAPGFGSSVRHRAPRPPCWLRVREAPSLAKQRPPSEAEFFALGTVSHPLTCYPQYPCAYLGSCVRSGKRLDQPVRDARRPDEVRDHRGWVMMTENRARNGKLGVIIGALIAVGLAAFLLTGGEHVGKKTVNSDADLPPVATGQSR